MWYFMNKTKPKEQPPLSLDEAFDLFCEGISNYGPFWDHVLGYWKASQESPNNILFLWYEDLKREPSVYLKRLAVFLGQPFTIEEESEDVAQKIAKFCSFENLSNLEINKCGVQQFNKELAVENSNFFRKLILIRLAFWLEAASKELHFSVSDFLYNISGVRQVSKFLICFVGYKCFAGAFVLLATAVLIWCFAGVRSVFAGFVGLSI
ncbi:hypothetical protein TEA_019890 [Camellia sinensis var. sinensis]|uniref:Sulfotransferase n=1 Tax=Camellia sinensis var. sinensis TaxID=542762 RepID=A0A4S4D291_CAMSN|nr:hypothetical protein TEA_019890 [Camellia sinensis var. sinensis]